MSKTRIIENRIWKYRNTKKLKQSELAFLIGQKNASQVSCYERGRVIPKMEQLVKLCYCLGVSIETLYPRLTQAWQEEVEERRAKLSNHKIKTDGD